MIPLETVMKAMHHLNEVFLSGEKKLMKYPQMRIRLAEKAVSVYYYFLLSFAGHNKTVCPSIFSKFLPSNVM